MSPEATVFDVHLLLPGNPKSSCDFGRILSQTRQNSGESSFVSTLAFPQGKVPFSRRFANAHLHLFPTAHTTAVTLSSRRSGAKPSAAQRSGGGATPSLDLLRRGALS
jgi:hypothetical protein